MKTRRERRQEARENSVEFKPFYEGRVITKEQYDKEVAELKKEREETMNKLLKEKALKELSETLETVE